MGPAERNLEIRYFSMPVGESDTISRRPRAAGADALIDSPFRASTVPMTCSQVGVLERPKRRKNRRQSRVSEALAARRGHARVDTPREPVRSGILAFLDARDG